MHSVNGKKPFSEIGYSRNARIHTWQCEWSFRTSTFFYQESRSN